MPAKHPAKYNDALIPTFAASIPEGIHLKLLDPFAGTGKIFKLLDYRPLLDIHAVEIEPDWADCDPRTIVGDALALPFPDKHFDVICVSPCYGNRMSDNFDARDSSVRNTYTHTIGHKLHPNNSGTLQWGEKYRDFHIRAWRESARVCKKKAIFILNCKNHIRKQVEAHVTEWHVRTLVELSGWQVVKWGTVPTSGNRFGENAEVRIDYENIITFRRA